MCNASIGFVTSDSLFTATSSDLYLTLDILLGSEFKPNMTCIDDNSASAAATATKKNALLQQHANKVPNEIFSALRGDAASDGSDAIVNALMDVLIWSPSGRLRDMIAHGRAPWLPLGQCPAQSNFFATIILALLSRHTSCCHSELGRACMEVVSRWQPRHHPIGLIQRSLGKCLSSSWDLLANRISKLTPVESDPLMDCVTAFFTRCFPQEDAHATNPRNVIYAHAPHQMCWQVFVFTLDNLSDAMVELLDAERRLVEQAASRRRKRPALEKFRSWLPGIARTLRVLVGWIESFSRNPHSVDLLRYWNDRAILLFNWSGSFLRMVKHGEVVMAVHSICSFMGQPHLVGPCVLNAKEQEKLGNQGASFIPSSDGNNFE